MADPVSLGLVGDAAVKGATDAGAALAPVAAGSAPLDLLAGGAAAGSAIPAVAGETAAIGSGLGTLGGTAGLGAGADLGAGLAAAAPGATGLSDAAISALEQSPGAQAFGSLSPLTDASTGITGATPGGVGTLTNPNLALPTVGSDTSLAAIPGQTTAADTLSTADFTTQVSPWGTGTTFGAVPAAPGGGGVPFTPGATPDAVASVQAAQVPISGNVAGTAASYGAFPGSTATGFPAAPGGSPGVLSSIGSAIKDVAPVAGIAGLGLAGYNAYEQNQQLKALQATETNYQTQLAQAAQTATAAAQPLLTSGEALTQYLQTGTLPSGLQQTVNQFVASAKAARIQAASNMGQSTNPEFNTALGQDLAAIDSQGAQLTVQFEQQLAQSGTQMVQTATSLISQGVSATNIASQLPIAVQNLNIALAKETSTAIASFAAALNGRSPGTPGQITINTSGQIV